MIQPLAPARYKVQFTLDEVGVALLIRAQARRRAALLAGADEDVRRAVEDRLAREALETPSQRSMSECLIWWSLREPCRPSACGV